MKRGGTEHPKIHILAAVLDVQKWGAVGIVETLLHFVQQYAPAGDVGKYPDEHIARAVGWSGNAGTLISGMVKAGWLDRCSCHRIRVHDWHQHADQTVQRYLQKKGTGFLPCYQTSQPTSQPASNAVAVIDVDTVAVADSVAPRRPEIAVADAIWKHRRDEEIALMRAVSEIARLTGRDPPEIMRQVTAYKRKDGSIAPGRVNPAELQSGERVTKSLEDARAWLKDLEKKRETG